MISIAERGVKLVDAVSVRNCFRGSKWVPGTIIQETGPLSAPVELEDGMVVRRHQDQLISRTTEPLCPVQQLKGQAIAKRGVLFRRLHYPV